MNLLGLVITLIVVAVLLGLLNHYGPTFFVEGRILQIINVLVIICVIIWLLKVFGLLDYVGNVTVPRAR